MWTVLIINIFKTNENSRKILKWLPFSGQQTVVKIELETFLSNSNSAVLMFQQRTWQSSPPICDQLWCRHDVTYLNPKDWFSSMKMSFYQKQNVLQTDWSQVVDGCRSFCAPRMTERIFEGAACQIVWSKQVNALDNSNYQQINK